MTREDLIAENEALHGLLAHACEALAVLADRENWTSHGISALAVNPLIYGHFDPVELARDTLAQIKEGAVP